MDFEAVDAVTGPSLFETREEHIETTGPYHLTSKSLCHHCFVGCLWTSHYGILLFEGDEGGLAKALLSAAQCALSQGWKSRPLKA